WLDLEEKDLARRYKFFRVGAGPERPSWIVNLHVSADGIHWGPPLAKSGLHAGDRTTVFYNPFRKVWVYSIRDGCELGRSRRYWAHPDILTGLIWKDSDAGWWTAADKL